MTKLIVQNSKYSVKVASIDGQHQKIFDTIHLLDQALAEGKGKTVVKQVLDDLVSYTMQHFNSEEALLEKQGYPRLTSHKVEHKALIDKVKGFQKDFQAGRTGVAAELMGFLMSWLKDHILATDQQYSPFLVEKGVH